LDGKYQRPEGTDTLESTNTPQDEKQPQRKRLFTLFIIVGVMGLALGFLSILNAISAPFPHIQNLNTTKQTASTDAAVQLRNQDTDGDGLSDYDEIFVTHTSPFVKDSDSDGKTDKEEVDAKTDPNCPTGQVCGLALLANSNTNGSASKTLALRSSLQNAGVPSYVLQQTDDETLIKTYEQAVGLPLTNTNGSLSVDDLNSLNATQVRSLLKANGVDDATLNSVDDATLLSIYQEAISSQNP
jgi:hypothetical protein